MTLESVEKNIKDALRLLDGRRVAEALSILDSVAAEDSNYKAADTLERLRQTYGFMIHYLIEGLEDTTRPAVYSDIVASLRNIADDLLISRLQSDSPMTYFSTQRICRHRNLDFRRLVTHLAEIDAKLSLAEIAGNTEPTLENDRDRILRDIFDLVWTERNNSDMTDTVVKTAVSGDPDRDLPRFIITALTLSLLGFYDRNKLLALLDIYDNTGSEQLAGRALTGILLALRRHKDRVLEDSMIITRLKLWEDSILNYSRLRDVVREIVKTRDTDRVTAKMRDEVIPELMKLKPDMLKKMKDQGLDFESGLLESNPEWEEMLEKNGIADKMRELTEMQTEGADLMMVTFSNLKGFPFFNSVGSWFIPFNISSPSFHLPAGYRKPIASIVSMSAEMCDSDKYSLVLAFESMPEAQREMMLGQFESQLGQLTEEHLERLGKISRPEFNASVTVFVRELYRFFKLFRKKDEFEDPFSSPFAFLDLPVLGDMLGDEELLRVMSEFYFKRGYYTEALELFRRLEDRSSDDNSYWEKVGYSLQNLKRYDEARVAYMRAELLREPGQWLLKRLAFINRKTGNAKDAAEYYSRALANDPENISLIMHTGYAKSEAGDAEGALASYYHAGYLDPDNPKIWRAIAWQELVKGSFEKSLKYYDRIMAASPSASDFLNAGHAAAASGDLKKALFNYRKSAEGRMGDFEKEFVSDYGVLESLGMPRLTLDLILDKLKMGVAD